MIAAMMFCGIVVLTATSCSNDDNGVTPPEESKKEWPKELDYSQWMKYLDDKQLVAESVVARCP